MSKRKLEIAKSDPIVHMMVVKTHVSGNPTFECNADLLGALKLLNIALATITNAVAMEQEKFKKAQADMVDKPREFLGPREG